MEERRAHTRALEAWVKANGVGEYPLTVHDFGDADADQGRATLALRPIKAPRPLCILYLFIYLLLIDVVSSKVRGYWKCRSACCSMPVPRCAPRTSAACLQRSGPSSTPWTTGCLSLCSCSMSYASPTPSGGPTLVCAHSHPAQPTLHTRSSAPYHLSFLLLPPPPP